MKFSIIIPTYNRAMYVLEAIDSVLEQSYKDFEVIVVDDGSTDDTGVLVKNRYSAHESIRYFYKQNEERGAARNFGLNVATGEYAVFFDSDDWMKPDYLRILYNTIIELDIPPVLIAAKYNFRDDLGREWPSTVTDLKEGWYGLELFLKGNFLACNFCIRIATPGVKLFPTERHLASMEDWLFLLQNLVDKQIYIKDEVGIIMREHEGRSMANNQKIITARKFATQWALTHIYLSPMQQKALNTYSAYFYGIHEFLDGNRRNALKESVKAMKWGGVKLPFLSLFLKAIIGKQIIDRIKVYAS